MRLNVLFNNGKRAQMKSKLALHLQKAGRLSIEGDGYMTRHMEAGVIVPAIVIHEVVAPEIAEAPAVSASKAAQDLAAENGIDLSAVVGTGLHGNITKADVEKAINA